MLPVASRRKKASAPWKGLGIGAGLGAGLMFLLDPDRGGRRRALARDKAIALARRADRILTARSRDLGNRARGAAAEIRSALRPKAARRQRRDASATREKNAAPRLSG